MRKGFALLTLIIACTTAPPLRAGVHILKSKRWPLTAADRAVYYVIAPDVPAATRRVINAAAERWTHQARGIIEVVPANQTPGRPYILFRIANASELLLNIGAENARSLGEGLVKPKGANEILIGNNVREESVLHALGHRVGLAHEFRHCRRDEYLKIAPAAHLWLMDETLKACALRFTGYTSMPDYDVESIMHHNPKQFGTQAYELTERAREETEPSYITGAALFGASQLSYGDLLTLRDLYCDYPDFCPNAAFRPGVAYTFARTDYVIILVSGNRNVSVPLGYSGRGSMYAARTPIASPAPPLRFEQIAEGVPLERRTTTVGDDFDNFNKSGHVPPGIYFLHQHRVQNEGGPTTIHPRPRLGMSDAKCATTHAVGCDHIHIRWQGKLVDRENIQFHAAFNNLGEMRPKISEGCITSQWASFVALFPPSFLNPATSPMFGCVQQNCSTPELRGDGNILVFVTDSRDAAKQDRQVTLFHDWKANLTADVFATNSATLDDMRGKWALAQ